MTDLATEVRDLISRSRSESERTLYGQTGLGVSDLGHCREYARRLVLGQERTDSPTEYDLAALVGTAVGREMELLYATAHPKALIQEEVIVNFEVLIAGEPWVLNIPGHPDVIDYDRDLLIDWKTVDGLGAVRSRGSTQQQRYQVSLYADAAIKRGLLSKTCTLAVVHIDRSGQDTEPYVDSWTFEQGLVAEAEEWLNDVLYAIANGEETSRDMPRTWCWACCPYASACRTDTDVEGLIEDPIILDAIRVYKEAGEIAKKADKDRKSAASVLEHVSGNTADWSIRHTEIGGGRVEYDRKPYTKLDITPNRPKRRAKDEPGRVRDAPDVRGPGEVPAPSETA